MQNQRPSLNKRLFSNSSSQQSLSSAVTMSPGQFDELKDILRATVQEEMKEILQKNSLARTDSISSATSISKQPDVKKILSKKEFENNLSKYLSDDVLLSHLSFYCSAYNNIRTTVIISTWLRECQQEVSREIKYPTMYLMKLKQGPPQELKVGIVDAAAETNRVIMGMLSKRIQRSKESKVEEGDDRLRASFLSFIHTCWDELHFTNLGKVN